MLRWIWIFGGLLIMMGHHARSEALFYYFRLEGQVPGNHLLRLIDKHISFEFVREQLKDSYSETGRPSIDPEVLLRILLLGYLYGITSERKLVEELGMHLAWRWFTVGFLALALHRGSADVLARHIAGKKPVLRSLRSPPVTQDLQELRREHYVTVFLSLALLDPQDHALAVDGGRCVQRFIARLEG